jgi:hypothetical protein
MNPQTTPNSIEENEIILGTGMGPLRFGATMDEVRTLVGEPEEIEESEDEDDFEHQAWNYYEDDHLRCTSTARTISASAASKPITPACVSLASPCTAAASTRYAT